MEGKNSNFEIIKFIEKLKNRDDRFFFQWQKTFAEERSEQQTKKLKAICNKLNEIETYIEELKK